MTRLPVRLEKNVYIAAAASAAGKNEAEGPLGSRFDVVSDDDRFGQDTWEKAESEMQRLALGRAAAKAGLTPDDIDAVFAGDLLNQCVASNYGLLSFGIPFFGLYGACSTAAEGLILSALLCGAGARRCAAVTSSHFCSAERQFRFPLEYGGQRTPTAQWTVTAAGAFILSEEKSDAVASGSPKAVPRIAAVMPGIVTDRGIDDLSNMGAAMAPAAADTLTRYFSAGADPDEFDLIVTGDLGREGSEILRDLIASTGRDIRRNHVDCGLMIYDVDGTDRHAGGSGCGCSAAVMAADILENVRAGVLKRVLFVGTGALMSPLTVNQKGTIPGIAHLCEITGEITEAK
ncbi:MAG: stage V sporulation protein AD [Clostridia bacterium]|nr:stage V sporulation protein AD [Clostridia bacterium]